MKKPVVVINPTYVGYARVSTVDQSLEIQEAMLRAAGCREVFSEKQTGASTDTRDELAKCLASLSKGDVLLVTKLDRLARSVADLANIMKGLQARGIGFRCLNQAGVDTTSPVGMLIFHILAAVAEFEREIIAERRDEGIRRAKALGKYKGRARSFDWDAARAACVAENLSLKQVAERFGCSEQAAWRVCGAIVRRRRDCA